MTHGLADPLDVHVMSDNAQAQLAAKDARIAELEAEVTRLQEWLRESCGFIPDGDLQADLERHLSHQKDAE